MSCDLPRQSPFNLPLHFNHAAVAPLTPNLQELKHKRRNRSSKNILNNQIPPSNPPTPKPAFKTVVGVGVGVSLNKNSNIPSSCSKGNKNLNQKQNFTFQSLSSNIPNPNVATKTKQFKNLLLFQQQKQQKQQQQKMNVYQNQNQTKHQNQHQSQYQPQNSQKQHLAQPAQYRWKPNKDFLMHKRLNTQNVRQSSDNGDNVQHENRYPLNTIRPNNSNNVQHNQFKPYSFTTNHNNSFKAMVSPYQYNNYPSCSNKQQSNLTNHTATNATITAYTFAHQQQQQHKQQQNQYNSKKQQKTFSNQYQQTNHHHGYFYEQKQDIKQQQQQMQLLCQLGRKTNISAQQQPSSSLSSSSQQSQSSSQLSPQTSQLQLDLNDNKNFNDFVNVNDDDFNDFNDSDQVSSITVQSPSLQQPFCSTPEQIQTYKQSIVSNFKQQTTSLHQVLSQMQIAYSKGFQTQQELYNKRISHLQYTFDQIIKQLKQKHQEMCNTMTQSHKQTKLELKKNFNQVKNIRSCLNRYNKDIDSYYQDIVEWLDIEQFDEIMLQYHNKLDYWNQVVKGLGKCLEMGTEKEVEKDIWTGNDHNNMINKGNINQKQRGSHKVNNNSKNNDFYTTQVSSLSLMSSYNNNHNDKQDPVAGDTISLSNTYRSLAPFNHKTSIDRSVQLSRRLSTTGTQKNATTNTQKNNSPYQQIIDYVSNKVNIMLKNDKCVLSKDHEHNKQNQDHQNIRAKSKDNQHKKYFNLSTTASIIKGVEFTRTQQKKQQSSYHQHQQQHQQQQQQPLLQQPYYYQQKKKYESNKQSSQQQTQQTQPYHYSFYKNNTSIFPAKKNIIQQPQQQQHKRNMSVKIKDNYILSNNIIHQQQQQQKQKQRQYKMY